jgi:hypothetical protein
MTKDQLAQALARMVAAMAPYMRHGDALECSRNIASVLHLSEATGWPEDPYLIARDAISHRMSHGWLHVTDLEACAQAMASAWRGGDDARL